MVNRSHNQLTNLGGFFFSSFPAPFFALLLCLSFHTFAPKERMEHFKNDAYTGSMDIMLYIGPFAIALLGLCLLFLDPKKRGLLAVAIILFLICIGLSIGLTMQLNSKLKSQSQLTTKLQALETWKETQVAKSLGILAEIRPQALDNKFKMEHFASFGWTIYNDALINSLIADKAVEQLAQELPRDHFIAKPVFIKNLPEDIDRLIVTQTLESIGFAVDYTPPAMNKSSEEVMNLEIALNDDEKAEENTKTEKDKSKKNKPNKDKEKSKKGTEGQNDLHEAESEAEEAPETSESESQEPKQISDIQRINVMYYGSYVKDYEIKLIALIMIRAGVEIKVIRVEESGDIGNGRTVIFDWLDSYKTRPSMSPSTIYNQKSFRR